MKFYTAILIALVLVATTTQGFLLKAALKKKLPLLALASLSDSTSSPGSSSTPDTPNTPDTPEAPETPIESLPIIPISDNIPSLIEPAQPVLPDPSWEIPISEAIPPTVTLYAYPVQHQVIYRSIRPSVVSRTVYAQEPRYSDRILRGVSNLIPTQVTGALTGLQSLVGNVLSPAPTSSIASPLPAVRSAQTYYIY